MINLPIDTAVVVPANVAPLIDDTDFKTRETAVAYNAAGMDLVWNFVTPAGVQTQTAVTPTTSGVYDWTHVGDGMYSMEIPASGGGSINNNARGYGWFSGLATGVLPWAGPIINFGSPALAPMPSASFVFQKAATSKTIYLHARDAVTGAPKTALVYNTSGLVASYALNLSARAAITLATLASASAVWSSGGFILVDDTNMPGLYRLDLPNAALASTDQCEVYLNLAGVEFTRVHLDLVDYDPIAAPDTTATLVDAFWDEADAEVTTVPVHNASFRDKLNYVFQKMRNKATFNKSTGAYALFRDDGSTQIGAGRTDTDNGTTYTKAEDA